MKYFVTIRGRTREIEFRDSTILVDGDVVDAEVERIGDGFERQLRIGERHRSIIASPVGTAGRWLIHFDGQAFEAEVVDERTRAIRSMSGGGSPKGAKKIVAPMPGMIVRVNVAIGDTVVAGQGLVVVEAMKMENELKATADGAVTGIEVTPGDTVEKGALLISIE